MSSINFTRRQFLYTSTIAGAAILTGCASRKPRRLSANDKLNIGVVGCGGKGSSDTDRVIDVVVVTRRFGPTMASSIGSMCGSTSPRAPSATRTMSITDATAEPKQPSSAISPIRMA